MANFFFELRLSSSKKWYWKRQLDRFRYLIAIPPFPLLVTWEEKELTPSGQVEILRVIRVLRAFRVLRMFLFFGRTGSFFDHHGREVARDH